MKIGTNLIGSALGGALGGAVYALFARLPIKHAALAYAVWCVASNFFGDFAVVFAWHFTNRKSTLIFVKALSMATTVGIGIKVLRERKLMGDKLMAFSVAVNFLAILYLSAVAIDQRNKGN